MATLTWNDLGTRFYETGVDRGVLYTGDSGVPWNSLISVDENPTGGDNEAYYLDGIQYQNSPGVESFGATISAYYSPPEFDPCEGVGQVQPGLFASQQRRKSFSLCYRTLIGNDTEGLSRGYKLHIIYNALVNPVQKSYKTIGESTDLTALSWSFTVKPILIPGLIPSGHLIVDSRTTPPFVLVELESILYGTTEADPRLPTPTEISEMFQGTEEFTVTDLGGGSYSISGSSIEVSILDDGVYQISSDGVTSVDDDNYEITSP